MFLKVLISVNYFLFEEILNQQFDDYCWLHQILSIYVVYILLDSDQYIVGAISMSKWWCTFGFNNLRVQGYFLSIQYKLKEAELLCWYQQLAAKLRLFEQVTCTMLSVKSYDYICIILQRLLASMSSCVLALIVTSVLPQVRLWIDVAVYHGLEDDFGKCERQNELTWGRKVFLQSRQW